MNRNAEPDFAWLAEQAIKQDPGREHLRPVVEKELLHYDILFALEQGGFLRQDLVFHGGTLLRLCYGSSRFSEDLDFAGGKDFSSARFAGIKECLEHHVGARHGLEVTVREPTRLGKSFAAGKISVHTWRISIVTAPARRDIPRQRIKLEIANIPAYTKKALRLRRNYDFLPDGYEDILVFAETADEVMADKLVSLPGSWPRVRYRDMWDIAWLDRKGAAVRPELVARKIDDYQLSDYRQKLDIVISKMPALAAGAEFRREVRRFLPADVHARTVASDKAANYLSASLPELLKEIKRTL